MAQTSEMSYNHKELFYLLDRKFIEFLFTTGKYPTHGTQIFILISEQCLPERLRKISYLKDISPSPIFPLISGKLQPLFQSYRKA
jgi:hypothetical protein